MKDCRNWNRRAIYIKHILNKKNYKEVSRGHVLSLLLSFNLYIEEAIQNIKR